MTYSYEDGTGADSPSPSAQVSPNASPNTSPRASPKAPCGNPSAASPDALKIGPPLRQNEADYEKRAGVTGQIFYPRNNYDTPTPLPPGWDLHWDEDVQRWYYADCFSDHKQFELPMPPQGQRYSECPPGGWVFPPGASIGPPAGSAFPELNGGHSQESGHRHWSDLANNQGDTETLWEKEVHQRQGNVRVMAGIAATDRNMTTSGGTLIDPELEHARRRSLSIQRDRFTGGFQSANTSNRPSLSYAPTVQEESNDGSKEHGA